MEKEAHLSYTNRCYVFVDSSSALRCQVCKSKTRMNTYSYHYKGRMVKGFANYCPRCKAFFIYYGKYINQVEQWEVLNSEENLQRVIAEYEQIIGNKRNANSGQQSATDLKQKLSKARSRLTEQKKNREVEEKKESTQPKRVMASNQIEPAKKIETIKQVNTTKRIDTVKQANTAKQVKLPHLVDKSRESILKTREHDIDAHDFIVRSFSSVFKCRNKAHKLKDIRATFNTISRKGTINTIEIPAGYCAQCNIYFVLESTYLRIRQSGVPICRMIDEKKYIVNGIHNSVKDTALAQESVLMQFGYTVSQAENLPMIQRRAILAAIVDYHVLTKNEVISYLDYFIRYRKNQKNPDGSLKFGIAIDKWKDDREFISKYEIGDYTKVSMKRIITNRG